MEGLKMKENIEKGLTTYTGKKREESLNFFFEKGYTSIEELEEFYVSRKACKNFDKELFSYLLTKGINVEKLTDLAIKYGNENLLLLLAKLPDANIKKIEDFLLSQTPSLTLVRFAKDVPKSNISKIIKSFIRESSKKDTWSWYYNDTFLFLASIASERGDIENLNICVDELIRISKEGANNKLLEKTYRLSNASQLYQLSQISGVDALKLEDSILETHDWAYILCYVKKVKGVNIEKVEALMCKEAYTFAIIDFIIKTPNLNHTILIEELYKRTDAQRIIEYMLFSSRSILEINALKELKEKLNTRKVNSINNENNEQKLVRTQKSDKKHLTNIE